MRKKEVTGKRKGKQILQHKRNKQKGYLWTVNKIRKSRLKGMIAIMQSKHHIRITMNTCSFSAKAKASITIMLAKNKNAKAPKMTTSDEIRTERKKRGRAMTSIQKICEFRSAQVAIIDWATRRLWELSPVHCEINSHEILSHPAHCAINYHFSPPSYVRELMSQLKDWRMAS